MATPIRKVLVCYTRTWRDKINGNTYYSGFAQTTDTATGETETVCRQSFTYGDADSLLSTVLHEYGTSMHELRNSGFMIVQTNRECTKKQCENFVTP